MTRLCALLATACAVPEPAANPVDPDHDFDGDGLSENGGDCDDQDADVKGPFRQYPDDDGDGLASSEALEACPGLGATAPGTDCDDGDATVDDGLEAWVDADGDTYGAADPVTVGCTLPPSGYADRGGDCDDTAPDAFPDAEDTCWTPDDESCGTALATCRLAGDVVLTQGTELALPDAAVVGRLSGGDLDGDGAFDVVMGARGVSVVRVALGGAAPVDVVSGLNVPETRGLLLGFGGSAGADLVFEAYDPTDRSDLPLLWVLYDPVPSGVINLDVAPEAVPIALPAAVGLARGGYALAAGDLDGDGADDLVATGPSLSDGDDWLLVLPGQAAPKSGTLSFATDGVVATSADETIHGLGDDVVVLADLAGTGEPALALVSHGDDVDGIELAVFEADDVLVRQDLGAPWGQWETDESAPSDFDPASVAVGDVDGDGALDLVVGVPSTVGLGAAYVLLDPAPTGNPVPLATVATRLEGDGGTCGTAVALVGDLFGPSQPGVAVGCPTATGGAVHLVPGETALGNLDLDDAPAHLVPGSTGASYVGFTLVGGGDHDGDGWGDLAVGVEDGAGLGAPDVFVVSGGLE